jgi:hypothetical protein
VADNRLVSRQAPWPSRGSVRTGPGNSILCLDQAFHEWPPRTSRERLRAPTLVRSGSPSHVSIATRVHDCDVGTTMRLVGKRQARLRARQRDVRGAELSRSHTRGSGSPQAFNQLATARRLAGSDIKRPVLGTGCAQDRPSVEWCVGIASASGDVAFSGAWTFPN